MSRTVAPSDLRIRGFDVVRQADLERALGCSSFALYCAFLDVRDKTGGTSAPLSDVCRRVAVLSPRRPSEGAPLRMTVKVAKRHLAKLVAAGLVKTSKMFKVTRTPSSPGGWRARRTVYGLLLGPVTGTVYLPKKAAGWVKSALAAGSGAGGHGGTRWTGETHPDVAEKLRNGQLNGGTANAQRWLRIRAGEEQESDAKRRRSPLARARKKQPFYAGKEGEGGAIKLGTTRAIKRGPPELSRGGETTVSVMVENPGGFSSKNPLSRRPESGSVGSADAFGAYGATTTSGGPVSRPDQPSLAAQPSPVGGMPTPPHPDPVEGALEAGASYARFQSRPRRSGPAIWHSVPVLEAAGLPVVPSATDEGLLVRRPSADMLLPADTLERKVELLRRAYEAAVVGYASQSRPKVLGHPRPLKPSKTGWWPVLVRAVKAFEDRGIAPMAWCAYWVDKWQEEHPGEPPPFEVVFATSVILKPRGFFSGPSTDYASRGSVLLPVVRDYMERRCLLHEAAATLEDLTREKLVALAAHYFPEGVDVAVERCHAEVRFAQREMDDAVAAGRWVWEPRSRRDAAIKTASRGRGRTTTMSKDQTA